MASVSRIDAAISAALDHHLSADCPPRLASAVRYAVLPGGGRLRPRLCLAVAMACAADDPRCADSAAVAIELLHCASLVHDDLPCFDNAEMRRGRPSVHVAFDERLALLVGDELIVMAFEVLALGAAMRPERLHALMRIIGQSVGAPNGIIAGQAYECEPGVDLRAYQQAKTGALFAAATAAGAAAAGRDPEAWAVVGARVGEAYQVLDDLLDARGDAATLGKPVGQDEKLGRPSAVRELGCAGAFERLDRLLGMAVDAVPLCAGRDALVAWLQTEAGAVTRRARSLLDAA